MHLLHTHPLTFTYTGDDTSSNISKLSGPGEPLNKYDVALYNQFNQFIVQRGIAVQASITFVSDLATTYDLSVRASAVKPKPLPPDIDFGTIQIGAQSTLSIPFHNSADNPVWVQLVPPGQQLVVQDGESERELFDDISETDNDEIDVYQLSEEALRVVYVEPRATVQLGPVVFLPNAHSPVTHKLFVKNNLSIIASTSLHGTGGLGKLEFFQG